MLCIDGDTILLIIHRSIGASKRFGSPFLWDQQIKRRMTRLGERQFKVTQTYPVAKARKTHYEGNDHNFSDAVRDKRHILPE